MKRVFDFSLALIGLFISMPLWFLFAWAIFIEDGWPIFYTQERVGKYGKIFNGWKFRSMIKDAEKGLGAVQAKENDPRVTEVGRFLRKTAMDELPQLLNIAKGDMSFVGPRALRPKEIENKQQGGSHPDAALFDLRNKVRPGLTGVAQVFAPRDIPRSQKLKYDLWYIDNQSFLLDIKLILSSFWITLNKKWDTSRRDFIEIGDSFFNS